MDADEPLGPFRSRKLKRERTGRRPENKKVKKVKLTAILNTRNMIIVKKDRAFFKWLEAVLRDGLGELFYDVSSVERRMKDGTYEHVDKKIGKFVDRHEEYTGKIKKGNVYSDGSKVEVIYGHKRAFITVRATPEKMRRFMRKVAETSIFAPKK